MRSLDDVCDNSPVYILSRSKNTGAPSNRPHNRIAFCTARLALFLPSPPPLLALPFLFSLSLILVAMRVTMRYSGDAYGGVSRPIVKLRVRRQALIVKNPWQQSPV